VAILFFREFPAFFGEKDLKKFESAFFDDIVLSGYCCLL